MTLTTETDWAYRAGVNARKDARFLMGLGYSPAGRDEAEQSFVDAMGEEGRTAFRRGWEVAESLEILGKVTAEETPHTFAAWLARHTSWNCEYARVEQGTVEGRNR